MKLFVKIALVTTALTLTVKSHEQDQTDIEPQLEPS